MEGHGRGLAAAVVRQAGRREEPGQRGDGDDAAVVVGNDGGQELAHDAVVRELVNGHDAREARVLEVEDRVVIGDAGVVEDDGGVADLGFDLVADGLDRGRVREIDVVVVDVFGWMMRVSLEDFGYVVGSRLGDSV